MENPAYGKTLELTAGKIEQTFLDAYPCATLKGVIMPIKNKSL